jgi:predicted nucleotidyltransferase
MQVQDGLIDKAITSILTIAKPRKIILFGSAANGTMTANSDLDLLVIEEEIRGAREENVRLRSALRDLGIPVDIFAMTTERYEETKGVIGGLAYPAAKYGRVIYEAP